MSPKYISAAFGLSLVALAVSGCEAPPSVSAIEALGPQARPAERRVQTGLVESLGLAPGFEAFDLSRNRDRSYHPNLEALKVLVSYGPSEDPRTIFLLASFSLAANQQADGIRFFETFLARYQHKLSSTVEAHHLTAYAILRATYAARVGLLRRIGWVKETTAILQEANRLTEGEDFLVRWASGLIYAQYPSFFGKRDEAFEHLHWTLDHPELEPAAGFYREVYRHLSRLHAKAGETDQAERYRSLSGVADREGASLLMGPFATTRREGTVMHSVRRVVEVIPGRVFVVRGFGFSDISLVTSANGNELIAIDAGTQPFSLQAAWELFESEYPDHPPLTTVLITHAHWDHIGGHTIFRELNADVVFYGRDNPRRVLDDIQRSHSFVQFRSERFRNDWVAGYAPDVASSGEAPLSLSIGESAVELIPIQGGETEDALLIYFPELSVMFVGDFLMPYYGEPWVEEGSIEGLLGAMSVVVERAPQTLLHGHFPLTEIYPTAVVEVLRGHFRWLADAVEQHVRAGYSRVDLERLNLIPPGLQEHPEAFIAYVNARQHMPARIHDLMVGIWQEDRTGSDLTGLDLLSRVEYGKMMGRYFKLSPAEVVRGLRSMVDDGENELALKLALAAEAHFGNAAQIRELKVIAADRLRAENQFINPFKFTVYSELIDSEVEGLP